MFRADDFDRSAATTPAATGLAADVPVWKSGFLLV
jgi:hypothetical protein